MDMDHLLIMLLVCGAAYGAGYGKVALALLLLVGLVFLFSGKSEKSSYKIPTGGVRVHGAETLEPIIIETTRGAPFRIPEALDIRMNPTWSAQDFIEKATIRGLGSIGRMFHRAAFGGKYK